MRIVLLCNPLPLHPLYSQTSHGSDQRHPYKSPGSNVASADWRLVNVDNLVQLVKSCDIVMLARFYLRAVQLLARCLYKISLTRELFPEPDTPVTQVITPSGNFTSIFFKLFCLAPSTSIYPVGVLRSSGTGILILPLK